MPPKAAPAPPPEPGLSRWTILAAFFCILFAYGGWMRHRIAHDPSVIFLTRETGAEWIVPDEPVSLETHGAGAVTRVFRVTFNTTTPIPNAVMTVRALQQANATLDQNVFFASPVDPKGWKTPQTVKLPALQPGAHELRIIVQNVHGPVALWAMLEPSALSTGLNWEVSADGARWSAARLAHDRPPAPLAKQFISPWVALLDWAPLFIGIFGAVSAAIFSQKIFRRIATALPPSRSRWLMLGAWSVLALNNIFKVPAPAGFDVPGHIEYTLHVFRHWSVPYATDGWQMFQSPFYYFLNAAFFTALNWFFTPEASVTLLRLLPLACGLLQIELGYRVARRVFPGRADLQTFAILFAGALPMNLYLSHYVGNEPLSALLSSAAFALCLKLVRPSPAESNRWTPLWLGTCLGLAVLTKVSAVVMGGTVVAAVICAAFRRDDSLGKSITHAATMSAWIGGSAALLAGWYYVRNWIHLGRPFIGGWDVERGIVWWQEPGFRVGSDFSHFGAALTHPFYVGLQSVIDGLYASFWSDTYLSSATARAVAPQWNYGLMSASLALALAPSLILLVGVAVAAWRSVVRSDAAAQLALIGAAAYGLAVIHHILTVPFYCAVKSFYALGAMPMFLILAAHGFDGLTRTKWMRSIAWAVFTCWFFAAFGAYLIRP